MPVIVQSRCPIPQNSRERVERQTGSASDATRRWPQKEKQPEMCYSSRQANYQTPTSERCLLAIESWRDRMACCIFIRQLYFAVVRLCSTLRFKPEKVQMGCSLHF